MNVASRLHGLATLQSILDQCAPILHEQLAHRLAEGETLPNLIGIVFNSSDPDLRIGVLTKDEVRGIDPPSLAPDGLRPTVKKVFDIAYGASATDCLCVAVTVDTVYGILFMPLDYAPPVEPS